MTWLAGAAGAAGPAAMHPPSANADARNVQSLRRECFTHRTFDPRRADVER
jgi:hypothetical protein